MHRHTEHERVPIWYIEPVQLRMTELSQTAVVFFMCRSPLVLHPWCNSL